MADTTRELGIGRHRRVMALEIRSRRFGFVVLEGTRLLDWGVRSQRGSSGVAGKKIASLMDYYQPTMVVMKRRHNMSPDLAQAAAGWIGTVRGEAKRRSIEARTVTARKVRKFFGLHGCTTKHAIASMLAEWFEELAWKLPTKRKPWQSERHNTVIFDAAATAMAFLTGE